MPSTAATGDIFGHVAGLSSISSSFHHALGEKIYEFTRIMYRYVRLRIYLYTFSALLDFNKLIDNQLINQSYVRTLQCN